MLRALSNQIHLLEVFGDVLDAHVTHYGTVED